MYLFTRIWYLAPGTLAFYQTPRFREVGKIRIWSFSSSRFGDSPTCRVAALTRYASGETAELNGTLFSRLTPRNACASSLTNVCSGADKFIRVGIGSVIYLSMGAIFSSIPIAFIKRDSRVKRSARLWRIRRSQSLSRGTIAGLSATRFSCARPFGDERPVLALSGRDDARGPRARAKVDYFSFLLFFYRSPPFFIDKRGSRRDVASLSWRCIIDKTTDTRRRRDLWTGGNARIWEID